MMKLQIKLLQGGDNYNCMSTTHQGRGVCGDITGHHVVSQQKVNQKNKGRSHKVAKENIVTINGKEYDMETLKKMTSNSEKREMMSLARRNARKTIMKRHNKEYEAELKKEKAALGIR